MTNQTATPAPAATATPAPTPAADKVAKIQTALAGKYRPLQATLKTLRDAGELPNTIRVNVSHAALKAIAAELLNTWLLKAAEFETQCNTLEAKINAVKAKVAAHVVTDNCTFADRILSGTETEKIWLTRRDQSKITLIKAGDFYITFAGDALRLLANMPERLALCVDRGALKTGFVAHAVDRYTKLAQLAGLSLHLIDI